ncbi:hypothetical protein VTN96DRAFT_4907 [Rasamsonia emersonii]|uniref:Histidine acid phosphatase n=1 Tax=Rasamsonia emersonii (strain ATCC 16479 / CBS 393.64 / IMI 116815) TaxID=1408163 RepID=A0A0F4YTM5_RASE3|nr:hypothetical protein T310_4495 [Rasamsonia emersonii CBS 393.64]KKA21460.1 hypothetical protein T310_4495 [Rasamsonia emersonii CBS 393.64]
MIFSRAIVPLALQLPILAVAGELTEHIWAVFAFNVYGDSTPTVLPQTRTLTSLGAHSLYDVGAAFRDRYVLGSSNEMGMDTWIRGISPYRLVTEEVNIYSTTDQHIAASALAFMQGLYPPLESANGTYLDDTYLLADGQVVDSPLKYYQYPRIYTTGLTDSNSISVAGHADCFMHRISELQYQSSPEFQQVNSESMEFYASLYDIALAGVFDESTVGYANAYSIFEYLQYGYVHNSTVQALVSLSDLNRAKLLADQYVFATHGNLSASGLYENDHIRAIAGRALSRLILQSFEANIETHGASQKMTLVFGSFQPVVAFAALAELAHPKNRNFYGLPVPGASLVLELYSLDDSSSDQYPDVSNLFVRFLFRNSTYPSTRFTYYPLFGHGPSQIAIPFREFQSQMQQFSLSSTEEWCNICNSSTIFCDGVVSRENDHPTSRDKALSLAGAGAIGACVTLATLAAIAGIAWLCGLRVHRRRKPGIGGFKGSDKMASDHDVSFKSSTGVVSGGTDGDGKNGIAIKGHEQTGSWEMEQQKRNDSKGYAASHLDDHADDVLQVNPYAEPVTVHESV